MSHVVPWNTRFEIPSPTILHDWHGVPPGVKRVKDIVFKTVGERSLMLDVYMPEAPSGRIPAIVWVSGGGWRGMNRHGPEKVSAWLCGHGFAVLGVEYRVIREAPFPAMIEDLKAAVRWARGHAAEYGFDPDGIGAWGDSAGGHLVELLGVTDGVRELEREGPDLHVSSRVKAVCAFYPPCDMRPYAETTHADLFPGDGAERDRWIELASPIRHVSRTSPPHVLVHGDRDDIIPVEHSYRYEQALRAAGVECTTAILPCVGHSGRILYGSEEVKALVAAFFERWLR